MKNETDKQSKIVNLPKKDGNLKFGIWKLSEEEYKPNEPLSIGDGTQTIKEVRVLKF